MKLKWGIVALLIATGIATLLLLPSHEIVIQESPQYQPVIPRSIALSKDDITKLIIDTAQKHEIDETQFLETAKCESSLRPEVIGDGGASVGLWQIHLVSHPDVTVEQAKDPFFATEWSAKKFKKNPRIWTCYRILYGSNS